MTLHQLRMGSFWMVVGATLCHEAVVPLVSALALPKWLSTGVVTLATLGGAANFSGATLSWYDRRSQGLKEFAASTAPLCGIVIAGTAAAVAFHFVLLLHLNTEWHQILVVLGGAGVFGALVLAQSCPMAARERSCSNY